MATKTSSRCLPTAGPSLAATSLPRRRRGPWAYLPASSTGPGRVAELLLARVPPWCVQEAVTGMPAALEGRHEQAVHEVPDLLRLAISTQPADREAPERRGRPTGTTASATK